jgi:hypothetical protein
MEAGLSSTLTPMNPSPYIAVIVTYADSLALSLLSTSQHALVIVIDYHGCSNFCDKRQQPLV